MTRANASLERDEGRNDDVVVFVVVVVVVVVVIGSTPPASSGWGKSRMSYNKTKGRGLGFGIVA